MVVGSGGRTDVGLLVDSPLSQWDLDIFRIVVPGDHYLRKVASVIPWDDFGELLAPYYCQDMGRPSILPVVMLKLE